MGSLALVLAVVAVALPTSFMEVATALSDMFRHAYGNEVVLGSTVVSVLCLVIAISPIGSLRLGLPDEEPAFSRLVWFSMLFAAGMGAGLLYWGVAEPISHLLVLPPVPDDMAVMGEYRVAMVLTYMHWAFHPWGIYTAGALCIAYFSYRYKYGMLPSVPLRGVLPVNMLTHALFDVVDILAMFAVILGLSASLSAGVMQIESGLQWLLHPIVEQKMSYLLIVMLLAIVFLLSASTPLNQGIKVLSEMNMQLAIIFIGAILAIGPWDYIWYVLQTSIVDYVRYLPELSLNMLVAEDGNTQWSEIWTVNYLLAWIAWIPFVGIFIARISRGRTIREFVFGVMLAPSLFTILWFSILGGTALSVDAGADINLRAAVNQDTSQALFSLLGTREYALALGTVVVFLVFIFLVTSADSASYVLGMLASRGRSTPRVTSKVFWGCVVTLITIGTLFSGQGIHSVRALFSLGAIPMFVILMMQMACLVWALLFPRKGRSR